MKYSRINSEQIAEARLFWGDLTLTELKDFYNGSGSDKSFEEWMVDSAVESQYCIEHNC